MCWAEDELDRVESRCNRIEEEYAETIHWLCDLVEDVNRGILTVAELRRHADDVRRKVAVDV